MKLSIIIPVLDEARAIPHLLAQLAPLRARGAQVLIVDGGSHDDSVAIATHTGVHVLVTEAGRALQMNAGARTASGDILLFLHADTSLPPDADHLVRAALKDGDHAWGRFDVRIAGRSRWLRLIATMMNIRSRATAIATGDQAIFVRRDVFERVGGFPAQPLMEDIELSRRLRRHTSPACVRPAVVTSGRRWERDGVWATVWLMWRLRWWYWRGVSAAVLAERYR